MTIPKITSSDDVEIGNMGEAHLAHGKRVAMRRWHEPAGIKGEPHTRPYETVGYVVSGSLELNLDGETAHLKKGDSWLVPAGSTHFYRVIEDLVAIEATSPPAREESEE